MEEEYDLEGRIIDWNNQTRNLVETIEEMQETQELGLFKNPIIGVETIERVEYTSSHVEYHKSLGAQKLFFHTLTLNLPKGVNRRIAVSLPYRHIKSAKSILQARQDFLNGADNNCTVPVFRVIGEYLGTFYAYQYLFHNVSFGRFEKVPIEVKRRYPHEDNLCSDGIFGARSQIQELFLLRELSAEMQYGYELLLNSPCYYENKKNSDLIDNLDYCKCKKEN